MTSYQLRTYAADLFARGAPLREHAFTASSDEEAVEDAMRFLAGHQPPPGSVVILSSGSHHAIWSPPGHAPEDLPT